MRCRMDIEKMRYHTLYTNIFKKKGKKVPDVTINHTEKSGEGNA